MFYIYSDTYSLFIVAALIAFGAAVVILFFLISKIKSRMNKFSEQMMAISTEMKGSIDNIAADIDGAIAKINEMSENPSKEELDTIAADFTGISAKLKEVSALIPEPPVEETDNGTGTGTGTGETVEESTQ